MRRVFKGKIHDMLQWRQRMFDGSYATFEKIRRPDTSEIVAIVGDRILVQFQRQPQR